MRALWLSLPFLAHAAQAETNAFTYYANLSFDPNRVIGTNGATLGMLMTELFGQSAAGGQAPVSGSIVYDLGTQAASSNARVAAYPQAIRESSLKLGGLDLTFDIALTRANAATSKIGLVARSEGFCADAEHCEMWGVRNHGWGMQGLVLFRSPHVLLDETGPNTLVSDAFGFQMGRTAAVGEFTPAFQTQSLGVVSVDGLSWGVFGKPGSDFLNGLSLPPIAQLIGTQDIERSELWIEFEGANLIGPVRVEGTLAHIEVIQ